MCFIFNDAATTQIYTLSLHDALPIFTRRHRPRSRRPTTPRVEERARLTRRSRTVVIIVGGIGSAEVDRSEEHTSELQSQSNLVCRLLLEKKKQITPPYPLKLL